MKPFKLIENDDVKILRSENANYNFCKKTGYTELWGKTKDDEILFSEIGPFILDIEVTTICKHGCKFCSPPGTRVNTKDGFKNIEDIKVGEDVLGVVFSDGKKFIKTQTVQELYVNDYDGELIQIETENGDVLKLTPDHVVFLKDGTEKPAGELTIEDELISIESDNLNPTLIKNITRINYTGKVYNFHCLPSENYLSENVLVHNCYKSNTKNGTNMPYQTFKKIFDNMTVECMEIVDENGKITYINCDSYIKTQDGIKLVRELKEGDSIFLE